MARAGLASVVAEPIRLQVELGQGPLDLQGLSLASRRQPTDAVPGVPSSASSTSRPDPAQSDAAELQKSQRAVEVRGQRESWSASPTSTIPPAPPEEPVCAIATEAGNVRNPSTYRTEMCGRWRRGHCSYGSDCQFAHGEQELLPRARSAKYKTVICQNFSNGLKCPYGARCNFIHQQPALPTQLNANAPAPSAAQLPLPLQAPAPHLQLPPTVLYQAISTQAITGGAPPAAPPPPIAPAPLSVPPTHVANAPLSGPAAAALVATASEFLDPASAAAFAANAAAAAVAAANANGCPLVPAAAAIPSALIARHGALAAGAPLSLSPAPVATALLSVPPPPAGTAPLPVPPQPLATAPMPQLSPPLTAMVLPPLPPMVYPPLPEEPKIAEAVTEMQHIVEMQQTALAMGQAVLSDE